MKSITQEIMELQAQLQFIQNVKEVWKDDECMEQIAEVVKNTKKNLSVAFGDCFQRLGEFQPKESVIEKVVTGIPECMKGTNEGDRIPTQSCLNDSTGKSLKYIPVLAKEGLKHEVGAADERGGLLTDFGAGMNTLQYLACLSDDNYDRLTVNTMEELKELGLLKKNDLKEHSLTVIAANNAAPLRFRFLLEWYPSILTEPLSFTEKPFMHHVIPIH